ncbi:hypothetical protein K2X33_09650 [bacterium]|nr:hypothetical protein [bacterium]
MRWLLLICLFAYPAEASYRIYKLKVTEFSKKGKPVRKDTVLSTLDHLQYEHYYGGFRTLQVELEDTWYCPGDTSRRKPCLPPKTEAKRGVASTEPKRGGLSYSRQPVIP